VAADLEMVRRLSQADRGLAIVAVARPDGSVHASVVNAGILESEPDGPHLAFVTGGQAKKIDHLRRNGRAAVVFRTGWQWASVEGPVHVIGPDDDPDGSRLPALLRAIFTAAGGTHEDWATFDRVMAEERRVAVLVHPERVLSNG
jgi:PPOX class probable F420-dependent enzyme